MAASYDPLISTTRRRQTSQARRVAILLCGLAAGLAVMVLGGHAFDIDLFKTPISLAPPANVVAASTGLLVALAIGCMAFGQRRSVLFLASVVIAVAAISFLQSAGLLVGQQTTAPIGLNDPLMGSIRAFLYAVFAGGLLLHTRSSGQRLEFLQIAGGVGIITTAGILAHYGAWFTRATGEPLLIGFPFYAACLQLLLAAAMIALAVSFRIRRSLKRSETLPGRTGFLLGGILLVGVWAFISWNQEASIREQAKQEQVSLARLLEEHALRSIDPVDLLLRSLENKIERRGLARVTESSAEMDYVRGRVDSLPQLLSHYG